MSRDAALVKGPSVIHQSENQGILHPPPNRIPSGPRKC
jgi:hypothetical protein